MNNLDRILCHFVNDSIICTSYSVRFYLYFFNGTNVMILQTWKSREKWFAELHDRFFGVYNFLSFQIVLFLGLVIFSFVTVSFSLFTVPGK